MTRWDMMPSTQSKCWVISLITDTPKNQYPGIGEPCDKERVLTRDERRDIEPIYCPPAILFEQA